MPYGKKKTENRNIKKGSIGKKRKIIDVGERAHNRAKRGGKRGWAFSHKRVTGSGRA